MCILLGFRGFLFAKHKQCLPSTWSHDSAFGMGAAGIRYSHSPLSGQH